MPRAIVEGSNEKVKITCEANLGRPAAALILLRKLPNEAEFAEISFTDVPETRQDSCTPRVKRSYTTSASKELNGTMYKCEVSSYPGTPEQQRLTSDAKDFYVFPGEDFFQNYQRPGGPFMWENMSPGCFRCFVTVCLKWRTEKNRKHEDNWRRIHSLVGLVSCVSGACLEAI